MKFNEQINRILNEISALQIDDERVFNKQNKKYKHQMELNNPFTIEKIDPNGGDVEIIYLKSGRVTSIPSQVVMDYSKLLTPGKVPTTKNGNGEWVRK